MYHLKEYKDKAHENITLRKKSSSEYFRIRKEKIKEHALNN
jgi:hypothetical protein